MKDQQANPTDFQILPFKIDPPSQVISAPETEFSRGIPRRPGAKVIKLFTAVIYHHSMVILSFCVIKLYYPGNCCRIAVYYHGILTLEKVG
jgi:hypothetical protein